MSSKINIFPQLSNVNLEYYYTNGIIMSVDLFVNFLIHLFIYIDAHFYSITHKLATYSCTNTDYDQ